MWANLHYAFCGLTPQLRVPPYSHLSKTLGSHGGEYEDGCCGLLRYVVWQKSTDVSEVVAGFITRAVIKETFARRIFSDHERKLKVKRRSNIALFLTSKHSETSVNFYQATRLNNPEDCHLLFSIISHGSTINSIIVSTEVTQTSQSFEQPHKHGWNIVILQHCFVSVLCLLWAKCME
jgi:hypothetical protein